MGRYCGVGKLVLNACLFQVLAVKWLYSMATRHLPVCSYASQSTQCPECVFGELQVVFDGERYDEKKLSSWEISMLTLALGQLNIGNMDNTDKGKASGDGPD